MTETPLTETPLTLEESTTRALAAIQAGDLDDLAQAIAARREAIDQALASGQAPAPQVLAQVIDAGDRLCGALEALKRELNLDASRLRRIQAEFTGPQFRPSQFNLQG